MADAPTGTETEPAEQQTEEPAKEPDKGTESAPAGDRLPDDHPVVKALKKANDEAAAARLKVKEFEDRDLSDLDRLTKERDEAKGSAAEKATELARLKAAVKHGLDEDDLDLLGTGTPDEIEARAARLAKRLGDGARRPTTTLGRTEEGQQDPDAWLRQQARK